MRAHEFILEGKLASKVIHDDIGGTVQIHPDPDKVTNMDKFSLCQYENG